MSKNCRFCLKPLDFSDKYHKIDDEIKSDFYNVTQHDLVTSDSCMNIVCEVCLRSLQLASSLKEQLIANQQKFYSVFKEPDTEIRKKSVSKRSSKEPHPIDRIDIKQEDPLNVVVYHVSQLAESMRMEPEEVTETVSHFRCDLCGREYLHKEALGRHIQVFHSRSGKRSSNLEITPRTSKSSIVAIPKHKNRFWCEYCSKSYSKKCGLQRHVISEHKKQKFICGIHNCLKPFRYKHHCKAHLIKAHGKEKSEDLDELVLFEDSGVIIKRERMTY